MNQSGEVSPLDILIAEASSFASGNNVSQIFAIYDEDRLNYAIYLGTPSDPRSLLHSFDSLPFFLRALHH